MFAEVARRTQERARSVKAPALSYHPACLVPALTHSLCSLRQQASRGYGELRET
jgi:hypothetical protein